MRITCALDEILGTENPAPTYANSAFNFYGPMVTTHKPTGIKFYLKQGVFNIDDDAEWKLFVYERVEYRPDWIDDREAADRFKEEHDIPLSATPTKVEKKNPLIKVSGYTVYKWQWGVICIGAQDIQVEEDFIREIGGGALREVKE